MRFPSRFHAIAVAASLSLWPLPGRQCRAGDPGCAIANEVIETGDYFIEVESAAGAVGDVVGVAVTLHSRFENPGWIANARFPSDEPLELFTRYYRIKGEPGQVGAVTLCDRVLERAMRLCTYNYFHVYTG